MNISILTMVDRNFHTSPKLGEQLFHSDSSQLFKQINKHPVITDPSTHRQHGPLSQRLNIIVGDAFTPTEPTTYSVRDIHTAIEQCRWRSDSDQVFIMGSSSFIQHCMSAGFSHNLLLAIRSRETFIGQELLCESDMRDKYREDYRIVHHPQNDNSSRIEIVHYHSRRADEPRDKKKTQ